MVASTLAFSRKRARVSFWNCAPVSVQAFEHMVSLPFDVIEAQPLPEDIQLWADIIVRSNRRMYGVELLLRIP